MKYFVLLAFFFFSSTFLSAQQRYITVTDVANRSVRVKKNPARVILGESRMIYTTALLDQKEPLKRIVAWRKDLEKYDPDAYHKYEKRFPKIKNIVTLGNNYLAEWNLELILSLEPDLILLNLGTLEREQENGLLKHLEQAGIAAVFIDNRQHPEHNSIASIKLIGEIFDQEENAKQFSLYYQRQLNRVYDTLKKNPPPKRRLIFIEWAAGYSGDSCCFTFGKSSMGRMVELAGSRNWGSEKSESLRVELSFEALLESQPDIIVVTGSNWAKEASSTKSVLLGYEAEEGTVQKQLQTLIHRPGWSELRAVQDKSFYAAFHQFVNSPYHFVAIQAFAKWAYPEIFSDLDPAATFKEMHEKFLPIEYSGIFLDKLE